MALTVCGFCSGLGDLPGECGMCTACAGTGLVSDDGLLSDVAKQRLEDEADARRDHGR